MCKQQLVNLLACSDGFFASAAEGLASGVSAKYLFVLADSLGGSFFSVIGEIGGQVVDRKWS